LILELKKQPRLCSPQEPSADFFLRTRIFSRHVACDGVVGGKVIWHQVFRFVAIFYFNFHVDTRAKKSKKDSLFFWRAYPRGNFYFFLN